MLVLDLGVRNALRQWRRNLMLCLAVAVGVGMLVFAAAYINGWLVGAKLRSIADLSGHVQLAAAGYRDDPGADRAFTVPSAAAPALAADPFGDDGVVPAIARIRVPAVLRSEREIRGVELVGTAPERELAFSFLGQARMQGMLLRRSEDDGILLGRALAEALETEPGKRIVLLVTDAQGRSVERGLQVSGLFDTDQEGYEIRFAFVGRAALARLLKVGERVTEISWRLPANDPRDSTDLRGELRTDLGPALTAGSEGIDSLVLSRWQDLDPFAATLLEYAAIAIYIWETILLIALVFGLINTLLASVYERIAEIGLVQALGMGRAAIVLQVVVESQAIVLAGLILGLGLGAGLLWLSADGIDLSRWSQGNDLVGLGRVLYPVLRPADVYITVAMVVVLGLLGSLYPAWRAARIEPLRALTLKEA